jgi:ABC-2 type transport system ATP-binding protein
MAILETTRLGKDYGDTTAVASLDLAVEEGEIFGLLGPNGAGKTTTISMVCGVITPSRGTAVIAGHDIRKDPFAARRALGLVPQDLALYEEITARQNLAFFGSIYGLSGSLLAERIDWALGVAGLEDRGNDVVKRFSGGRKRRLNIAAGLLHKPRLLVLDEPTVGVDPQSRNYIFETVRGLQVEHGMTVIYTSHYMEEVQSLCERVAVMDHGKLLALDHVNEMIATHGGGSVEIEVAGPSTSMTASMTTSMAENLARAVAGLGDAGEVQIEGNVLRVQAPGKLGAIIMAVEQSGATLRSIHSLEADLETVFLHLTGKRLRDQ